MKKVLYFGLELPQSRMRAGRESEIVHCPLIAIQERPVDAPEIASAFAAFAEYTHVLLTSKTAVRLFFQALHFYGRGEKLAHKIFIAVGKATAHAIAEHGASAAYVAQEESSEGIVALLEELELSKAYLFWPHSELSRPVIPRFLEQRALLFCSIALYTTVPNQASRELLLNALPEADELLFTSPSTVDAFMEFCKALPTDKKLRSIGPVTAEALRRASQLPLILYSRA